MNMRTTKDEALDKALEQSFPASDPVQSKSATSTEKPGSDPSREAPTVSQSDIQDATVRTEECPDCHGADVAAGSCPRCGGTGRVVCADVDISPANRAVR